MRLSLTRPLGLTCVPLALIVFFGCSSRPAKVDEPTYKDDFGEVVDTPPITEASVSKSMMLHRRTRVEPYAGVLSPTSIVGGHFDWGPAAGGLGEIELAKDVFGGLSFDWAHQDVTDPISPAMSRNQLSSLEADQYYSEIDRYNLLLHMGYDLVLAQNAGGKDKPLTLRLGLGMGATIIIGDTAPYAKDNGYKIEDYIGFLMRPEVDLNLQLWENGKLFVGATFDYVYPPNVDARIGSTLAGTVREFDGDVEFSTFFLRAGFMIEF